MSVIDPNDVISLEDPSLPIRVVLNGEKLVALIPVEHQQRFRGKIFVIVGAKSAQECMIARPDSNGSIPLQIPPVSGLLWRLRVRNPKQGEKGWE